MVIFKENDYPIASKITWDDIIKKMENEFDLQTAVAYINKTTAPTVILHNENQPRTIFDAVKEIEKKWITDSCHVYTSFGKSALTFGRHNDEVNVLLVGAIGEVSYKFDDGSVYRVTPGDSLYIPAGVYHDPIVHSARATLSISTPQSPTFQI